MKPRNLLILLILTILLGALAYHRNLRERTPAAHPVRSGEAVFPELDINRIAAVTITGNLATTTLHRVDGRWRVAEKHDYHADYQRLRDLLTRIADLTIGRPLLVDDTIRRELQLLPPTADDADRTAGTHITMADSQTQSLAALVIGKPFRGDRDRSRNAVSFQWQGAEGRYIQTDAGTAFLVSEPFAALRTMPDDWIDRRFLDIPTDTLVAMQWRRTGRDPIQLMREEPDQPWQLRDAEDDVGTPPDTERIGEILATLRNLRFDDIVDPDLTPDELGLTETNTVTLTAACDEGRRYELLFGLPPAEKKPAVYPLRVSVTYELPREILPRDGEPSRERADTMHRHMETVRRIDERLGGWTYWIAEESAQTILVDHVDDLLPVTQNDES